MVKSKTAQGNESRLRWHSLCMENRLIQVRPNGTIPHSKQNPFQIYTWSHIQNLKGNKKIKPVVS